MPIMIMKWILLFLLCNDLRHRDGTTNTAGQNCNVFFLILIHSFSHQQENESSKTLIQLLTVVIADQ